MANCLVAFILPQPGVSAIDRFFQPFGLTSGGSVSTEYFVQMPFAATLEGLRVAGPQGGYSSGTGTTTYTIRVNGVDSALTCGIAHGTSPFVGADTTHTVAAAAGDLVSVRATMSAVATVSAGDVLVSVGCASAGPKSVLQWQCSGGSPSLSARFLFPYSGVPVAAAVSERRILVPRAGTLRNLRARALTPVAGSGTITYTVRVNGVSSALACTVSKASSPHEGSDTSNSVSVAAHDRVSLQIQYSSITAPNPTTILVSAEFEG